MLITEGKETGLLNASEIRKVLHKIEETEDEIMKAIKDVKIF